MASIRYTLAGPALLAWRASQIFRPHATGFRTLLLHDVRTDQRAALSRLIDRLRDRYDLITPEQAARIIEGTKPPDGAKTSILLSFDDGFASNHEVACTILDPIGIKALFFVCPGLIDTPRPMQREAIARYVFDGKRSESDLDKDLVLMDWYQISQLKQMGHTIGSHGASHRRLSALAPDQQRQEVVNAKRRLEEKLGSPIEWYAYAFGDIASINSGAIAAIAQNHRFCRSGVRGLNHTGLSAWALRGDEVDLSAPSSYQMFVAEGGLAALYRHTSERLDSMMP